MTTGLVALGILCGSLQLQINEIRELLSDSRDLADVDPGLLSERKSVSAESQPPSLGPSGFEALLKRPVTPKENPTNFPVDSPVGTLTSSLNERDKLAASGDFINPFDGAAYFDASVEPRNLGVARPIERAEKF